MAVIVLFLVLGGIIILFFGELVFTGVALALLTALLWGRVHLSGTWIHRAWAFVTAPPISFPAAMAWTSYFALGILLLWMLTRKRRPAPMQPTPRLGVTASEAPIRVDMDALERALSADSPPEVGTREEG
jgi:hypothetical protein